MVFKAIKAWFSAMTEKTTLEEANAAPYKLEAPKTPEQIHAEKLEQFELNNGDLDAPDDLAERAMAEEEADAAKKAAEKPKAKRVAKPKIAPADKEVSAKTAKPKAKAPTKPKGRTPKMTIAK